MESCHCHSITPVQNAVRELYRCVLEFKMKAKVIGMGGPKPAGRVLTVKDFFPFVGKGTFVIPLRSD